eukprot:TRINITY_DN16276_c0_g3_i2.p1 TRINITY_DN16276_c0_g3~~TRINITY_DN16276_c0_g3_i2.p1  ORF type:complete len:100 (-),score=16.77 TRINITY_DN16276_c0_g3_i2:13-312(-)
MRMDMEQHSKADCPNKLVPCNFCKKNVNLNLLEEHEHNCEFNMEAMIDCRYAVAGCEAKFKRRDQAVHEQEAADMHLSLIHICRCRRYAVCRSRWSPYH